MNECKKLVNKGSLPADAPLDVLQDDEHPVRCLSIGNQPGHFIDLFKSSVLILLVQICVIDL